MVNYCHPNQDWRNMFKFVVKAIFFLLAVFIFAWPVKAQSTANEPTIHFFWSETCPHCKQEKVFLQSLQQKYPKLIIRDYEVTNNKQNYELFKQLVQELEINSVGVPLTVLNNQAIIGYYTDETTGKQIETAVLEMLSDKSSSDVQPDVDEEGNANLVSDEEAAVDQNSNSNASNNNNPSNPEEDQPGGLSSVHIPLIGLVNLENFSLLGLTIIVAALDGFNPCAMWTLIFLISLLLGMKDRRRMWILGSAFIVVSSLVYFLFLTAWLNFFLIVGYVVWVRLLIGIVAIGAGGYYLRDFILNKDGSCQVTGNENRRQVFEKLKAITQKQQFWLALSGIILLAVAVNMVELICSAGLPAIYTQVLSLSELPSWQYYLYLALYILIFMLDDLIVFFSAMMTLQMTGLSSKYSRYSHLIGGVLMLILGVLLILKPEILMFS